ncbi:glycosyltransferase [Rhodococcus jostii]|uniref:glycosyltransferase n=1 Tax=Rhodococcus jostii TaxID=132919 RepID=UPI0039827030
MKIVHVVTYISEKNEFGGPVSVALTQLRALQERGHTVRLIAGWDGVIDLSETGIDQRLVPVRRITSRSRFGGLFAPRVFLELVRALREGYVPHIHVARDLITLPSARILAALSKGYVLQPHGMIAEDRRPPARVFDTLMTRKSIRKAEFILCLTDADKMGIIRTGAKERDITQINNGVRIPGPTTGLDYAGERGHLNVLFLARISPRKNVALFVRAAQSLVAEGVDATFSIVGPDGGGLDELRGSLKANDGNGRIVYEGALEGAKVLDRVRDADIYVLPSINEPFPMSVLEALSVGTPVVVTTGCQISDQLSASNAAVVCEPTVDSLVDAIKHLAASPDERVALGNSGRAYCTRAFNIDDVAGELAGIYQLIERGSGTKRGSFRRRQTASLNDQARSG